MRLERHSWFFCASAALLAGGCTPRAPQGLDSALPQQRMEAAVRAAASDDPSAVPALVAMLDSDDPAVRMVAIHSLEDITGETFGYDFSADDAGRAEAIDRWRRYAADGGVSGAVGGQVEDAQR